MLAEAIGVGAFNLIRWIFEQLPDWLVEPIDISPAIGLMMYLNEGLPVVETLALIGIVVGIDMLIFAFDTFNWLWARVPFLGGGS